jgi:hypothetical protein
MFAIDHVVLGSADLHVTGERLRAEHGLASVPGGRHPAWGTGNRIVPLGDQYVEALGVVDDDAASRSAFGRFLRELTGAGDRWYTVVIRDSDLDATASRLGLTLEEGHRERPDGRIVRWRRGLIEDPSVDPWLPFFIEWNVPDDLLPGRADAAHVVPVTGIAWVELGGEDPRVEGALAGADLPVRLVGGPPGVRTVGISVRGGDVLTLR